MDSGAEGLQQFESELRSGLSNEGRGGDYDLDDAPDWAALAQQEPLRRALEVLMAKLLPVWKEADSASLAFQGRHRRLAKIAIAAGTCSVVLAIFQIAVAYQAPSLMWLPLGLEALAVLAGFIAVGIGLKTQGDKKWLCERYRAERLRMLKFKSLAWEEFAKGDHRAWEARLDAQVKSLATPATAAKVKAWLQDDERPGDAVVPVPESLSSRTWEVLRTYYYWKRLEFQRAYFLDRAERHSGAARPWRNLSMPVYFAATGCVLTHFLAGGLMHFDVGGMTAGPIWKGIEIWALAFAAAIPVVGLGARVWLGAFEPHRSANLFAAKRRAVEVILGRFESFGGEAQRVREEIMHAEAFFENEHREWLRLMLETEWML